MAKRTPLVEDGKLYIWDEYRETYLVNGADITHPAEWQYWQEFLQRYKSFRVIQTTEQGLKFAYSVYKVKHPLEGKQLAGKEKPLKHGSFWIAHKRVNRKLYRKYIGKNSNVTAEKLAEVAEEIGQGKLG
jgi:hypothetical protein